MPGKKFMGFSRRSESSPASKSLPPRPQQFSFDEHKMRRTSSFATAGGEAMKLGQGAGLRGDHGDEYDDDSVGSDEDVRSIPTVESTDRKNAFDWLADSDSDNDVGTARSSKMSAKSQVDGSPGPVRKSHINRNNSNSPDQRMRRLEGNHSPNRHPKNGRTIGDHSQSPDDRKVDFDVPHSAGDTTPRRRGSPNDTRGSPDRKSPRVDHNSNISTSGVSLPAEPVPCGGGKLGRLSDSSAVRTQRSSARRSGVSPGLEHNGGGNNGGDNDAWRVDHVQHQQTEAVEEVTRKRRSAEEMHASTENLKKQLDRAFKFDVHALVNNVQLLHEAYQKRLNIFEREVDKAVKFGRILDSVTLRSLLDIPAQSRGSLLIVAIKQRHRDAIEFLTGHNENLKVKDKLGNTVHMVAPNAQGQLGRTALFEACQWGDPQVVRWVLNYRQGWDLPWLTPSGIGLTEVDLMITDRSSLTPLMLAVQRCNLPVVQVLTSNLELQHHPHVSSLVRVNRALNQMIDFRDSSGLTALCMAVSNRSEQIAIVQCLLDAEADTSLCDYQTQQTPLHLASCNQHISLVSMLLRMNSNPNARNARQETPLHLAVRQGALAIVANLLEKGANLTARDVDGNTPLHYLFIEKRKLVDELDESNDNSSAKHSDKELRLNFLNETIDLILRNDTHDVAMLLAARNKKGLTPFTEIDALLHFKSNREAMKDALGLNNRVNRATAVARTAMVQANKLNKRGRKNALAASTEAEKSDNDSSNKKDEGDRGNLKTDLTAPKDLSIFDNVLIQEAVDVEFRKTVYKKKLKSLVYYCILLATATLVGVLRTGVRGEQYMLFKGLSQIALHRPHGSASLGNTEAREPRFEDGHYDSERKFERNVPFVEESASEPDGPLMFEEVRTPSDFMTFVGGLTSELTSNGQDKTISSAMVVIGTPMLRQWRARERDPSWCKFTPRLEKRPRCFRGYESEDMAATSLLTEHTQLTTMEPDDPDKTHELCFPAAAAVRRAFEWRQFIGDGPVVAEAATYPSGSYALELFAGKLNLFNPACTETKGSNSGGPSGVRSGGVSGTGDPTGDQQNEDLEWLERSLDSPAAMLALLDKSEWTSEMTRAMSFDINIYNAELDLLSLVQLLVEFRPDAGMKPSYHIRTHRINVWNFRAGHVFLTFLETLLLVQMVVRLVQTIRSLARDVHTFVAQLGWSGLVSNAISVIFVYVCYLEICVAYDVDHIQWAPTEHYQSIEPLEYHLATQVHYSAMLVLLMWFELLGTHLDIFREVTILVNTIKKLVFALMSFVAIMSILYVAFGTAKFILPDGHTVHKDPVTSILAEMWHSLDGDIKMSEEDTSQMRVAATFYTSLISGLFAVLVVLILMNVLVTLLMDMYGAEKDAAESSWCMQQAAMILVDERIRLDTSEQGKDSSDEDTVSKGGDGRKSRGTNVIDNMKKMKLVTKMIGMAKTFKAHEMNNITSLEGLVDAMLHKDQFVSYDEFNACTRRQCPELIFYVGDVKGPDASTENASTKESRKVEQSLHATLRIVQHLITDPFLKITNSMGHEELMKVKNSLYDYAIKSAGLNDPEILQAMLVCQVIMTLGKVGMWAEAMLSDTHEKSKDKDKPPAHSEATERDVDTGDDPSEADANETEVTGAGGNLYASRESISHYRVLLHALLQGENWSQGCRFLPSFARLPITSRILLVEVFKADFNFGQFMQLENNAGSLLQLTALAQKRSITYIDPKTGSENTTAFDGRRAFHFCLMSQIINISGNMGGVMPVPLWKNFKQGIDRLSELAVAIDLSNRLSITTPRKKLSSDDGFQSDADEPDSPQSPIANGSSPQNRNATQLLRSKMPSIASLRSSSPRRSSSPSVGNSGPTTPKKKTPSSFLSSFRKKRDVPLFAGNRKEHARSKRQARAQLTLKVYNLWLEDLAKKLNTYELASMALKRINVLRKTGRDRKLATANAHDAGTKLQTEKLSRTLARLGRMCRHSKPEHCVDMVAAIEGLRKEDRDRLIEELGMTGIDDGWSILLMYAPAIMQNVFADTGSGDSKVVRLTKGLQILVLLFRKARSMIENHQATYGSQVEPNGVYEVGCYQVATWSKSLKQLESHLKGFFVEHKYIHGKLGEAEVQVEMDEFIRVT